MKLLRTFTLSVAAVSGLVAAFGGGCSATDVVGLSAPDASAPSTETAGADAATGPLCDKTVCGGSCVDTQIDPKNCGACGTACGEGLSCQAGQCALACAGGTSKCGDACVDMQVDKANCGACGTTCADGTVCSNGACKVTCDANLTTCDAPDGGVVDGGPTGPYCANAKTDNANCGVCGKTCAAGETCVDGACSVTCGAGQTTCKPDGGAPYCATLTSDGANCGACGATCGAGKVCSSGGCVTTCAADQVECNGGCIDPNTSPKYCGATSGCGVNAGSAGVVCSRSQACVAGACKTLECGNDCWGEDGCKTTAGRCVRFSCMPGSAGHDFCDSCMGWKEITRDQWLNQGYCGDIIARYRVSNGTESKCGGNAPSCCGTSAACGGSDNAWHFKDGDDTYFLGPVLGASNDTNCTFWNDVNNGAYTRITACERK